MSSKPATRWTRGVPAGTLFLVSMSIMALAGSNSTTLPNGSALGVSIDSPLTGDQFVIPVGDSTIDVLVEGTANVGGAAGGDAMIVYTIDLSGSTTGNGGLCGTILACEQAFFQALNQAVILNGSVNEVAVVGFGAAAAVGDLGPNDDGVKRLAAPDEDEDGSGSPDVQEVIGTTTPGRLNDFNFFDVNQGSTNCTAALQQSLSAANDSEASSKMVVFASDGLCITGGAGFGGAVSALASAGVVVNSIAIGGGSDCDSNNGNGSLRAMATGTGGTCFEVANPSNLPDIIPALIGSSLDSLEISVDGGAAAMIDNADIDLPLPQPGAVTVNYATTAAGLGPGEHEICVTANGSDTSGGTASVTQCETIQIFQLTASPATETNQLGDGDDTHTVTATILGEPGHVEGILVDFSVSGQNAGASGTCDPGDCTTNASGVVTFTYTVPLAASSLGDDTITVSTTIGGETATIDLAKSWVDETPPVPSCQASVNPHGKTIPRASRRNEDGFYLVDAFDLLGGDVAVFVVDLGSGTEFGPYAPGDTVKYTEAGGAKPNDKKMGSKKGKAGAVEAHITGNGDGAVYAVDAFGNASDTVACLFVPRPPK